MEDPPNHPAPLPTPDSLPHGEGFRFVTAVDERTVSGDGTVSGAGHWQITGEEAFFRDHFPQHPVLPGVLLIEALAQLSGLLYYTGQGGGDGGPARAGIARTDVVLKRPVLPPARVDLASTSRQSVGPVTTFAVEAKVDGKPVARGEIMLTAALKP